MRHLWIVVSLWTLACGDDASPPDASGADSSAERFDASTDLDATSADGGCSEPDRDGDGRLSMECGGDDCDDSDPNRFPGNPEVCDTLHHDEDCDDTTYGFRDADGDGVADANCCNERDGSLYCGGDCDDMAPGVAPTAPEVCNGLDDDCDDIIDEGVLETFYIDADNDDYGSSATDAETLEACSAPAGYADNRDDCDDASGSVHPAAMERCDEIDNNCDLLTDPGCACTESDTQPCGTDVGVCTMGVQTCVGGTWSGCAGGMTGGAESCNGADDDCDGTTDEGVLVPCWADPDMDGYAAVSSATMRCACLSNETGRQPSGPNIDCRPMDSTIHPGATELCDRVDQNCSIDGGSEPAEDADNDGYTAVGFVGCSGGYPKTDCHDGDPRVFPGQTTYFSTAANAPPSNFYDYNCSGVPEREPSMPPNCSSGGSICSTATCSGTGRYYTGTPACGALITDLNWTCRCASVSCGTRSNGGNLACR
jgi:hypothetical protein